MTQHGTVLILPEILSSCHEMDGSSSPQSKTSVDDDSTAVTAPSFLSNKDKSTTTTTPTPKPPTLVLHFDINETILIGDEAGGDTRDDVINKMLAKSAFVRLPTEMTLSTKDNNDDTDTSSLEPTCWWDGSSIKEQYSTDDVPPPPLYTGWEWPSNSCPYYRTSYKKRSKTFVQHHGSIYRDMYSVLQQKLTIPSTIDDSQSSMLAHVIPALLETLIELTKRQLDHRIVFRTFGSDLNDVATVITAFANGQHPLYPNFHNPNYQLHSTQLYQGNWMYCDEQQDYVYQLSQQNGQVCALGDEQVLTTLQQHTICGIRDDYNFWSTHNCEPWAGKPIWICDYGSDDDNYHEMNSRGEHHVLFDDNIHNLVHDSIASVRRWQVKTGHFETLDGEEIVQQHGIHLIRVPTIEPVLNPRWFLTQIDQAIHKFSITKPPPPTENAISV